MKCPKCNSKMKGSRVRGTFFVRVYNCRCGFVSDFAQVTPDVSRFSKIVGSMSLHNVEWRFSHLHSPRLPIPHLPYTVLAVIFLVFLSFSSEYANTLYGIPVVFSISKQTVSSLSKYSVRCALPSCRKRLSRNHQLISNMIEQNGQRLYFCKEQHLSYYKNPELVKLVSDSKRSFLKKFTLGAGLLSLSSLLLGRNLGLQEAPASITPPIQYGQWSLLAPVSWIIFSDGTHMYAKSGVTGAIGTIVYGGPSNAGGTSGTDVNAILNSMVTNIASNEGIQNSLGVTIAFLPGEYGGVGTNTVYLPNSGSPNLGLEITLRGSGKSITRLLGTRFVSTYSGWNNGIRGPKFNVESITLQSAGTVSDGSVWMNLSYFSVFLRHCYVDIAVTNTSSSAIYAFLTGGPAGPSLPCVWSEAQFQITLGSGSTNYFNTCVSTWFEGFDWNGGLLEVDNNSNLSKAANIGIYLGGGAANCIRSLDTYGMPVNYFIQVNNGVCLFESIEWPDPSQAGTHVFAARCTTIIAPGAAAAGAPKPTLKLKYGTVGDGTNDGAVMSMKLIGLSLGLLSAPFYVPATGQAVIGANSIGPVANPIASTDYRVITDLKVNCSGGTGVDIALLDDFGHTIQSGLTSLSGQALRIGEHINFGPFTGTPTVQVFSISG